MANKLLVAAANHWNSPFQVGTHELTRQFIKNGWQVAFISDPISFLHLFKARDKIIADRFKIYRSGGEFHYNRQFWTYVPFSILSPQNYPILRTKFLYNHWHSFTLPNILKKIRYIGFDQVDLIYIDNIIQSSLIEKISHKKAVYRIADNNAGFKKFSRNSALIEKKLVESVDLVVYSAMKLKEYVAQYDKTRTLYLPNGVNYNLFRYGNQDLPKEFVSIPRPRVVYVGAMDYWFDIDIINFAANKLSNVSFVLIGNNEMIKNKTTNKKNIYLLGLKPYAEISQYLFNSEVGIIPFRVKAYPNLVNSINPLKLHQYFACGLPVVSARWQELENMSTKALLYNNEEEFVSCLIKAITEPVDKQKLIDEAERNDWKYRYKELINHLGFDR